MDLGTSLIKRSRSPVTARMMNRIPSTHTAASAVWYATCKGAQHQ